MPKSAEHGTACGTEPLNIQTPQTVRARCNESSLRRFLTKDSREAIQFDTAFLTSLLVQPTRPSVTLNTPCSTNTVRRRQSLESYRKSSPRTLEMAKKFESNNFNLKKPSPSTVNAIQSSREWEQHQRTLKDWKAFVDDKRKALQPSISRRKLT